MNLLRRPRRDTTPRTWDDILDQGLPGDLFTASDGSQVFLLGWARDLGNDILSRSPGFWTGQTGFGHVSKEEARA